MNELCITLPTVCPEFLEVYASPGFLQLVRMDDNRSDGMAMNITGAELIDIGKELQRIGHFLEGCLRV